MPYSTWGFVTYDDIQDIEESMDMGTIHINLDNPPAGFKMPDYCPMKDCGLSMQDHEAVTITRAGENIVDCSPFYPIA
jgi:hypothetical protein